MEKDYKYYTKRLEDILNEKPRLYDTQAKKIVRLENMLNNLKIECARNIKESYANKNYSPEEFIEACDSLLMWEDNFKKETLLYLTECRKYYDYKESQKPLIEKQKQFEKEKRAFLQEVKMSKEPPTKKQLYYYDRLCKKYSIEKKETSDLSKLDLKKMIGEIIDEHSRNCEHINLCGD